VSKQASSLLDVSDNQVARSNVVINLLGQDHPTRNFSFEDVHVTLPHVIAQVFQLSCCVDTCPCSNARSPVQISRECGVKRFVSVSALSASESSESRWLASKVFLLFFNACTLLAMDPSDSARS